MSEQIFIQKKAQIRVRLAALGEVFWGRFTLRGILSRWARKLNVAFTLASLPVAVGFRTWGTTVYCCPSKATIYCGIFCLIFLKHFGFLFPSLPSWSAQWGQSPANYRKMLHLEHGHRAFWGKIRGPNGTCSDIASCNRTRGHLAFGGWNYMIHSVDLAFSSWFKRWSACQAKALVAAPVLLHLHSKLP